MVFDLSAASPATQKSKPTKVVKSAVNALKVEKPEVTEDLEEDRFKDSRGTGSREYSEHLHRASSYLRTRP